MTLTAIATAAGWILAGILAVIGVFDRATRQQRKDDDDTASNLIQNLKTTTELQEKEITTLRAKEVEQGKEIAHLQGQMKVLSEILQGRDPDMQEHIELGRNNAEVLANLAQTMSTFIETLQPVLVHIGETKSVA